MGTGARSRRLLAGMAGQAAEGGFTEAVGCLDLATTAAESVLIALLVSLLSGSLRTATCNVLLFVGVALWGLRVSARGTLGAEPPGRARPTNGRRGHGVDQG